MRRGATRGAAIGKARLAAVAASLAAPVALYFVVRTAAVALHPDAAAALPPTEYAGTLRPLVRASMDPRQRVTPRTVALAREAARSSPLAFEPFLILAKAEEQAGRTDRAIALAEEARRRRPTYITTRLQLLAYYQSAGRFEDMLGELDFALRRSPEARRQLLPIIAGLIRQPAARPALAAVLASGPDWRQPLMDVAREQPIPPADALALLELVRSRGAGDPAPERTLYVHRLLATGDVARARTTWFDALPPAERARQALLFDGAFRSRPGQGPFGWTLHQGTAGRAEIVSAGTDRPYLDVAYFGGSDAPLAEQTLALAPGRYRLAAQARGAEPIRSGEIFWSLRCLPQGPELIRLRLAELRPDYRTFGAGFAVPASGCSGQRLHLMAQAGDISSVVNLQIGSVEIVRGN